MLFFFLSTLHSSSRCHSMLRVGIELYIHLWHTICMYNSINTLAAHTRAIEEKSHSRDQSIRKSIWSASVCGKIVQCISYVVAKQSPTHTHIHSRASGAHTRPWGQCRIQLNHNERVCEWFLCIPTESPLQIRMPFLYIDVRHINTHSSRWYIYIYIHSLSLTCNGAGGCCRCRRCCCCCWTRCYCLSNRMVLYGFVVVKTE